VRQVALKLFLKILESY